jgi:hypothetical protein
MSKTTNKSLILVVFEHAQNSTELYFNCGILTFKKLNVRDKKITEGE